MSDTANKPNVLQQVARERQESKLKAFKSDLKGMFEEREKALDVVKGVEQKIIDAAISAGLTEKEVVEFFQSS